jgi:hypothetical protein
VAITVVLKELQKRFDVAVNIESLHDTRSSVLANRSSEIRVIQQSRDRAG